MAKKNAREEKFKNAYMVLIGIGFLIAGVGGVARTLLTNSDLTHLNSLVLVHPIVYNFTLNLTLSLALLQNMMLVIIGVLLVFYDRILGWLVKG